MTDRHCVLARMVTDTRRRLAQPLLTSIPDKRSATLATRSARGRFAAALQEAVARSESAPSDSEPVHEGALLPRLGRSHPRIDDHHRSAIW